jgi:hypothetical protein
VGAGRLGQLRSVADGRTSDYSESPRSAPTTTRARGVWAGVKLPGGQYRKRHQLARAHDILRRIAAGEISSRQLPENAALLARREHEAVPAPAMVLHLPMPQVGKRSAA